MIYILEFDMNGLLPPGDYQMTIADLRQSLLVVGPSKTIEPDWDSRWRLYLVRQLEIVVNQLWTLESSQMGRGKIGRIFIDGSFVECKAHPHDIDGYFECDVTYLANGQLEQDLNQLDPHKIWTWHPSSRRSYKGSTKKQLPMWHQYRVELYPHFGQPSGIKDEYGNDQQFPAAFRKSRDNYLPKGIIEIIK